jgi:DNA end-binding protein Ku
MLITLRHSEEVVPPGQLKAPANSSFGAKERHLAEKLIDALSARFEPQAYHDEYQQRIHDLIDAKRRGKKVMAKRAPRRRLAGSLTESLEASLKSIRTVRRS